MTSWVGKPAPAAGSALAAELKRARGGRSIDDMAAALSVNKNTLGSYERGQSLPGVEFLIHFAQVTGTPIARLFDLRLQAAGQPISLGDIVDEHLRLAGGGQAGAPATSVDEDLLREIIADLEEDLAATRTDLAPAKKALVITHLYVEALERSPAAPRVDRSSLRRLLRLVK